MPDPEVGQILTQLYYSSRGAINFPPASQTTQPAPQSQALPPPADGSSLSTTTVSSHPLSPTPASQSYTPAQGQAPTQDFQYLTPINPQPAAQKRTRFRPTKSCERCREKKLKCDREVPCGSCLRGRNAEDGAKLCYYRDVPEGEAVRSMKRARTEQQQNRQGDLLPGREPQRTLAETDRRDEAAGNSIFAAGTTVRVSGPIHGPSELLGKIQMRGKKSRYVSAGDRLGLLEQLGDITCFIHGAFRNPETRDTMRELSAFERAFSPKRKQQLEVGATPEKGLLLARMRLALTPEPVFKVLQWRYVLNWETIFRVLHLPSFFEDCDSLLDQSVSAGQEHQHDYRLPQALAAIAIAARLNDHTISDPGWGRIPPDQVSHFILLVQLWLDSLHGKALLKFSTLQIRTLLLIARQASMTPPLELWKDSGSLVRYAMAMGLHKDPGSCSEMSLFMKEMRRKVWMSVIELDVQSSLAAGMPAAIVSSNLNKGQLSHVDDEDLREDMETYASGKPWNVWTTALPQIALGASLNVRLDVANLLGGNVSLERDAPLILEHARTLEMELQSFPPIFRNSNTAGDNNAKRTDRMFITIMLNMAISRPLLALYRTITLSHLDAQYPEARKGALRCALSILSHLDALDPTVADPNIVKSRDFLDLFHLLCKNDIMNAALMVCFAIRAFNNDSVPIYGDVFSHSKHSLIRVVENTLNGLLQRLGEFGSDLKDAVPLSAVLQSGRSEGTEAEKRALMITGAQRVLEACRKIRPDVHEGFKNGTIKDCRRHGKHGGPHVGDEPRGGPREEVPQPVVLNVVGEEEYDPYPGSSDFDFMNFDFDSFADWDATPSWL